MLSVVIKPNAQRAILAVADFIESRNTPGSGDKWVNEVVDFIVGHSQVRVQYPLCRNKLLAKRKFSCIVFRKKWVVVFKKSDKSFTVYHFIFGPKLK